MITTLKQVVQNMLKKLFQFPLRKLDDYYMTQAEQVELRYK